MDVIILLSFKHCYVGFVIELFVLSRTDPHDASYSYWGEREADSGSTQGFLFLQRMWCQVCPSHLSLLTLECPQECNQMSSM